MGLWAKITQGLGIGIQMAAPVAPLINPLAGAALKVVEAVLVASKDPSPEKTVVTAFNTLGVPLLSYEVHLLADLTRRVQARMATATPETAA